MINEYEAGIVREIFVKYSQGYKARFIADEFKKRGARRKNGKMIDKKYIYAILHNERYTGRVEHYGVWYDNIFPPIISQEIWDKVQKINDENKLAPGRKKEIFEYILSGKLFCGKCRHRMSGISGTSKTGKVHYYYVCSARHRNKNKCDMNAVPKQLLEDAIIEVTAKMLLKNGNIEKIAKGLSDYHKKEAADNRTLKQLMKQRDKAIKASGNIVKAIEEGIITSQTKSRLQELEEETERLNFAIEKEKQRTYENLTTEEIMKFLRSKICANTQDIRVRKMLINTFVRQVILYEDKIIITYNFTDNPDKTDFSVEKIKEIERQSEDNPRTAGFLSLKSSYFFRYAVPKSRLIENKIKRLFYAFYISKSLFFTRFISKKSRYSSYSSKVSKPSLCISAFMCLNSAKASVSSVSDTVS